MTASIFSQDRDTAPIDVSFNDGTYKAAYVFDGHKYELVFKEEEADYYKVSILYSSDLGRTAYLWKKTENNKISFSGSWQDKWFAGSYDCLIALKEVE